MNYKKLLITLISVQLFAMDENSQLSSASGNPYASASAPTPQVLESPNIAALRASMAQQYEQTQNRAAETESRLDRLERICMQQSESIQTLTNSQSITNGQLEDLIRENALLRGANNPQISQSSRQSKLKEYSIQLDIAKLIVKAYEEKLVDCDNPDNQTLVTNFINDPEANYFDFMKLIDENYFATFEDGTEQTYFKEILDLSENYSDWFVNHKSLSDSCETLQRNDDLNALKMFLKSAITESKTSRDHMQKSTNLLESKINEVEKYTVNPASRDGHPYSSEQNIKSHKDDIDRIAAEQYRATNPKSVFTGCSNNNQFVLADVKEVLKDAKEAMTKHYSYLSEGAFNLSNNALDVAWQLEQATKQRIRQKYEKFYDELSVSQILIKACEKNLLTNIAKDDKNYAPCHDKEFLNEFLANPEVNYNKFMSSINLYYAESGNEIREIERLLNNKDKRVGHGSSYNQMIDRANKSKSSRYGLLRCAIYEAGRKRSQVKEGIDKLIDAKKSICVDPELNKFIDKMRQYSDGTYHNINHALEGLMLANLQIQHLVDKPNRTLRNLVGDPYSKETKTPEELLNQLENLAKRALGYYIY